MAMVETPTDDPAHVPPRVIAECELASKYAGCLADLSPGMGERPCVEGILIEAKGQSDVGNKEMV
jgi:hypothetical protein